jgi:type III secretion protein L
LIVPAGAVQPWRDVAELLEQTRQARDKAVAERDQVMAAAHAQGLREGLREGRRSGAEEAAALLLRTQAHVEGYLQAAHTQMVDLVLDAVRQVLGRYESAELIALMVRQALGAFPQRHVLTLWVAPAMRDALQPGIAALAAETGVTLELCGDPALQDCQGVLTSPDGTLDIGLEAQLARLRDIFRAAASAPASEETS